MQNGLSAEEKRIICENCARNLKVLRTYLGWKQRYLAEVVGTTHRRISEIENGKGKLSWSLFIALYTVFSLNPDVRRSSFYNMIISSDVVGYLSDGRHRCDVLLSKLEESERESAYKIRK